MSSQIQHLFNQYIKGTVEKAPVENKFILVCRLTNAVKNVINCIEPKVYITCRMLKHLYDSKPAEEFYFLVDNMEKIVKLPDKIYKNKDGKRGTFCLTKIINNDLYVCPIEIIENTESYDLPTGSIPGIYIATGFRLKPKKIKYLNNYELIWSWKGDNPSS